MKEYLKIVAYLFLAFARMSACAALFSIPAPHASVGSPTTVGNTLKLAWDASSDTNVDGYRIYYGDSYLSKQTAATVGKATNAVIDRLVAGKDLHIHIVSYDKVGMESVPSNTITNFIYPKIFTRIYSIAVDVSAPKATNVWQISTNGTTWLDYRTVITNPGSQLSIIITNDSPMKLIRIK
jgi:hypothetical protein